MAEDLNQTQQNVSRRLDVMAENVSSLTENLARLTESYDNSTMKSADNISKIKKNFI